MKNKDEKELAELRQKLKGVSFKGTWQITASEFLKLADELKALKNQKLKTKEK